MYSQVFFFLQQHRTKSMFLTLILNQLLKHIWADSKRFRNFFWKSVAKISYRSVVMLGVK